MKFNSIRFCFFVASLINLLAIESIALSDYISDLSIYKQKMMMDKVAIISNNLANTDNPGYKAKAMAVKPYHFDNDKHSKDRVTLYRNADTPPIKNTGSSLDIALTGGDFFYSVMSSSNNIVYYTQDARFTKDSSGRLISHSGNQLLDSNKMPIKIPPNSNEIIISENGNILVDGENIAKIGVFKFNQPEKLKEVGNSLYDSPSEKASAARPDEFKIAQYHIQESNVDKIKEMVNLVEAQRNFSAMTNIANDYDELQRNAVSRIGKIY
jgi:flagellar basal-body rod protein FlgF